MALRSYSLTLSASAKRVSDVYGGAAGVRNAATDIPYRQVLLQATGADAYLGDSNAVNSTTGMKVTAGAAPTTIGPFESGPIKLSDLWGIGTGATLQILGVPY